MRFIDDSKRGTDVSLVGDIGADSYYSITKISHLKLSDGSSWLKLLSEYRAEHNPREYRSKAIPTGKYLLGSDVVDIYNHIAHGFEIKKKETDDYIKSITENDIRFLVDENNNLREYKQKHKLQSNRTSSSENTYLRSVNANLTAETNRLKRLNKVLVSDNKRMMNGVLRKSERDKIMRQIMDADVFTLASEMFNLSGIYFLITNKSIVYVGQSGDISKRVRQHKKDGVKGFDTVKYKLYPIDKLDEMELMYIDLIKPKYNISLMNKSHPEVIIYGEAH